MEYRIKVITGSKKEGVTLLRDGRLEVSVDAPRKEGMANVRVCELVANHLGVTLKHVSIVRGQNQSSKIVSVKGK